MEGRRGLHRLAWLHSCMPQGAQRYVLSLGRYRHVTKNLHISRATDYGLRTTLGTYLVGASSFLPSFCQSLSFLTSALPLLQSGRFQSGQPYPAVFVCLPLPEISIENPDLPLLPSSPSRISNTPSASLVPTAIMGFDLRKRSDTTQARTIETEHGDIVASEGNKSFASRILPVFACGAGLL